MLKPKFNVNSLTTDADLIARIVPAGDLFSLMSRSILIPAGWAALATRTSRDPLLIRGGGHCEDEDTMDVLFVRDTPVECTAQLSSLRSADGFECRGSMRVRLRVPAEPAELSAFRKTVIGSVDSVSITDLQRYLHKQMSEVLAELAGRLSADELLQPLDASMVRTVAGDKLGPACLAGGLVIDGPTTVQLESPDYRDHCRQKAHDDRHRQRLAARTRIQQALAAAQKEHLTHLVSMLERMRETSEGHANLAMTDLLRTFSDAERGQMYAALWHLCPSPRTTRWVAAVSGRELLLFEPTELERPVRRTSLPETLGALRSVSADARSVEAGVLLIGAATGVHLVDIETTNVRATLPASVNNARKVHGGVNAAAMSDDHVFATHSELGLMTWPRNGLGQEPARPLRSDLTTGASAVRCARVAESRLWFTTDERLRSLPLPDCEQGEAVRYNESPATLSAVALAGGIVYAGNVNGQIIAWDLGEPASARVIRGQGGGPVESIHVVQTGGVDHLIVADRSSALTAMVVGDNFTRRYESPSHIVRRAAADDDLFVAMNDNRDQLIAWNPREPDRPTATVIIPHLTGSTVQDLCLIPSAPQE